MKLLSALGLDPKILIAQLINFSVLLFVLWRYGYRPLLKFMEDRKSKIAKGVEDARLATVRLNEAEKNGKDTIIKAKKEALAIIEKAKLKAGLKQKEIITLAKEEIAKIIQVEKERIKHERVEVMTGVKNELADLVILALEKVLAEKIDATKDKLLITKVIKELK